MNDPMLRGRKEKTRLAVRLAKANMLIGSYAKRAVVAIFTVVKKVIDSLSSGELHYERFRWNSRWNRQPASIDSILGGSSRSPSIDAGTFPQPGDVNLGPLLRRSACGAAHRD